MIYNAQRYFVNSPKTIWIVSHTRIRHEAVLISNDHEYGDEDDDDGEYDHRRHHHRNGHHTSPGEGGERKVRKCQPGTGHHLLLPIQVSERGTAASPIILHVFRSVEPQTRLSFVFPGERDRSSGHTCPMFLVGNRRSTDRACALVFPGRGQSQPHQLISYFR